MYGREKLNGFINPDYIYDKEEADKVMDAMEARIKDLESDLSMMKTDYEFRIRNVINIKNDVELKLQNRIKELEKKLEDVQNTMATDNVDLGMTNFKLKERIKELEAEVEMDAKKRRIMVNGYNHKCEKVKELEAVISEMKTTQAVTEKK